MEELDAENQELSDNVEHLLKLNNDLELKLLQVPKSGVSSSDCNECAELNKAVERRNEEINELRTLRDDNQRNISKLSDDVKRLQDKLESVEEAYEKLQKTLREKEEELLHAVSNIQHSSEIRRVDMTERGKEGSQQEQIRVLAKRNDMYREYLKQKNQEIRELEAKLSKGSMNSNCLDSPIRERRYNLRAKSDSNSDRKRAFRRRVDGVENVL